MPDFSGKGNNFFSEQNAIQKIATSGIGESRE
jgi:hypothetical protein